MKKYNWLFSATIILCWSLQAFSQSTFKQVWESKFENEGNFLKSSSEDGNFVIGSTKKDACVLNGADGSTLWCGTFLGLAQTKNAEEQQVLYDAGLLFLINKQSGNDELVCMELKSGKKLWSSLDYNGLSLGSLIFIKDLKMLAIKIDKGLVMVDMYTGKEKWVIADWTGAISRWVYLAGRKQLLLMNYSVNSITALAKGMKNQIMLVDANTGEKIWETTYKGVVEVKRFANRTFTVAKWIGTGVEKGMGSANILVDIYVKGDKVFLEMNGLTVIDLNTGEQIWKVNYDVSLNRGLAGNAQLYNAVADPLVVGDYVYIADFGKSRNKSLKKYELASGTLIWETEIDGRKVIIPKLYNANGVVLAQIGGYVNLQGERREQIGNTSYLRQYSEWKWQGPFGLKGFDEKTGKMLWETDKWDDRISNVVAIDKKIFAADKTAIYGLDPLTGTVLFTTPTKGTKTGGALFAFPDNDKIILLSENGISGYQRDNGSLAFAFKSNDVRVNSSEFYGKKFFLATDDEITQVDIGTGAVKGKYEYEKSTKYKITDEGDFLTTMSAKKVVKYKIE